MMLVCAVFHKNDEEMFSGATPRKGIPNQQKGATRRMAIFRYTKPLSQ